MTRFALHVSLALLGAFVSRPLCAQENNTEQFKPGPSGLPPVIAQPKGTLTGHVFCADTHKPARGAMVMVTALPSEKGLESLGGTMATVRVNMDGVYTAEHLPPGEYGAIALLPGYLSPFDGMRSSDVEGKSPAKMREAMLQNGAAQLRGAETATLDITLERGAAISGRVLYSDGSPATQVTLDLQEVNAKTPASDKPEDNINVGALMRMMFTHQSSNSDDQGRFRLAGLRPGKYRIAAVQPNNDGMQNGNAEAMAFYSGMFTDPRALHFYAGDTVHGKEAKVYELRAGDEESGVEITLPVHAFHTVSGSLVAKDGRAVNMGMLTLTDAGDDSLVFRTAVGRDGTFRFATVPSGTYTLAATKVMIGKPPDGTPAETPAQYITLEPTNAFADANTAVIVKETDVSDVLLTLAEVPLPKQAKPKAAPRAEPD